MASNVIPASTRLAAKRGFVRTTAQGYATALGGGIAASAVISAVKGEVDLLVVGVSLGVALVSPLLGGLASYLDITSKGVPEDYQAE